MNIEDRYQQIIEKLKLGHRFLEPLANENLQFLESEMLKSLETEDWSSLEKILCVLDHTVTNSPALKNSIIKVLDCNNDESIIYGLNVAKKHVIEGNFKLGKRLEFDFMETLIKLLKHSNPEVVEWTVRTMEECGSQGIFFKKDLVALKPKGIIFNKHKKATKQIIEMLEKRWSHFA